MVWFRRKAPQSRLPYVSGVLATVRKDRHPFAQLAIDSFLKQDWPFVQLVVYNGTATRFKRDRRVRELSLRPLSWPQMWNLAVHNADGTYCVLLHDDCHYAPDFLKTLMAGAARECLHVLRYKEAYSLKERATHLVDDDRVFCPLWRRTYPVQFGDDPAAFTGRFYNLKRVEGPASLVTRFVA